VSILFIRYCQVLPPRKLSLPEWQRSSQLKRPTDIVCSVTDEAVMKVCGKTQLDGRFKLVRLRTSLFRADIPHSVTSSVLCVLGGY
jgi:hypothetical protein